MKFGGFLFLAAALVIAARAYHPSSFDQKGAEPAHAPAAAAPAGGGGAARADAKLAANESSTVTLKSLPARAAAREALRSAPATAGSNGAAPVISAAVAMPEAIAASELQTTASPPEVKGERTATSLVRHLKRELRRVGCYDGGIDSDWDRSSRSAMGRFLERVNATLPVETPDHAMLALVRAQRAAVCGDACPSGQAMNGSGRCMPHAIVATQARKRTPAVAATEMPVGPAPFTTTVTVGEMQPTVAQTGPVARPAPLPGRMAMGGPVTARAAPEERSWWQTLLSGAEAPPRAAAAAPVKTPARQAIEPKVVRNSEVQVSAVLPPSPAPAAANGASDGTGLQTAAVANPDLTDRPVAKKPKASGRKSAKPRSSRSRTASRNWRGRNVQAMFQHPLGRM